MDKYIVKFYFSSGQTLEVTYSEECFSHLITSLKKAWPVCSIVDKEWGINFALVTHYQVKEIKNET